MFTFHPASLPAPDAPPADPPHLRAAAVAVCLVPLLGIAAATAALLLGARPPGLTGWALGAALLLGHAILTRAVARRAATRPR